VVLTEAQGQIYLYQTVYDLYLTDSGVIKKEQSVSFDFPECTSLPKGTHKKNYLESVHSTEHQEGLFLLF
jgi:hypothetical protein